ncbi:MAG: class I SAM-dependent methyltransferase [Methylocella sp.]
MIDRVLQLLSRLIQEFPSNYGVQDDPRLLLSQEKPFDAVVSTEVIEHLFSPHLLPQYAAAVLKEGGYLLITTPYHGYLKNLALSIFDKWDFHHPVLRNGGHIKFWSQATLTELLSQNGFRVIAFGGVGRFPYCGKAWFSSRKRHRNFVSAVGSNSIALRLSSRFDLDHQTPYQLTPPTWIDAVGLRYERFVLRLGKRPASAATIATRGWEPCLCLPISLPR